MKKIFLLITMAMVLSLLVRLPGTGQEKISQPKPVYVFLNFEGDPNFPSLTYYSDTTGLARFTGSAFRLTPQDRDWVVQEIIEQLEEKFVHVLLRPDLGGDIRYNIEFVTDTTGLDPDSYYTWGIDDSSHLYREPGYTCDARLWGKAGGSPTIIGPNKHADPNDDILISDRVDINGNSIYHPKHARTWAGSFSLIEGECPGSMLGGDFSVPPLIPHDRCTQAEVNEWNCGRFGDGTLITDSSVATALANNAAHEIAQLFGAKDVGFVNSIMNQELERMEGYRPNFFSDFNKSILIHSVGEAPRLATSWDEPMVTDTGTGLMWTKDANLPASIRSYSPCCVYGGGGSGDMIHYEAFYYTDNLEYAGYHDWRLPSALNFDGTGPCLDRGGIDWIYVDEGIVPMPTLCTQSELGHLYYRMLENEREMSRTPLPQSFNPGPFFNLGQYGGGWYWSNTLTNYWGFDFSSGEQFDIDTAFNQFLYVWPVRDAYKLVDHGDGTITDTSTGLMWVKDANLAGNQMAWSDANDWAGNLVHAGYDDWRLPKTREPDATCNKPMVFSGVIPIPIPMDCSQSEMGYLFNRWGITDANPGPFILVEPTAYYWSETEWASYPDSRAWTFSFRYGEQGPGNKSAVGAYAWAVRDIQPGDTSPGTDIRVEPNPNENFSVTFSEVTESGTTSVEVSEDNPGSEQPGIQFLGKFYDISTTATIDGDVQICFSYYDSDIPDGFDENDLKILHWDGSEWNDVTFPSYPDTVNNVICGSLSSLSWFGLALPEPSDWGIWNWAIPLIVCCVIISLAYILYKLAPKLWRRYRG